MGLSRPRLALRNLAFFRRTNAGTTAGVALAGAVLTGALFVGDSLRYTLDRQARARLGGVVCAADARERFFRADLAGRLGAELGSPTAAVLSLGGSAIRQDGSDARQRQVNRVRVLGVDERFWAFSGGAGPILGPGEAAVNGKLARALRLEPGDGLSLRVARPTLLPRDAPLAAQRDAPSVRVIVTVKAVVPDEALGAFSLEAGQVGPCNAFVPRAWLAEQVALDGRANLLLCGQDAAATPTLDGLAGALRKSWRLEDLGLILRRHEEQGVLQIESERVLLDPAVGQAAGESRDLAAPVGALTYLVNGISKGEGPEARSTPYSFVTAESPSAAAGLSAVPPDMRDDEMVINRWLADRLGAGPGDSLAMNWFALSPAGGFVEASRRFTVRRVVGMAELAGERALVPDFPGLSDVESCAGWDIGLPLDKGKLDDPDNEEYWKTFRTTPKALVTLRAGQEMWANRFGDLTAIRFPLTVGAEDAVRESLQRRLDPAQLGLFFIPVAENARKATAGAQDFGSLFLGMSGFLVLAALLLVGLLFVFGVEMRSRETGLLLALGWRRAGVRNLLLMEGALLALLGSAAGAGLGSIYARALIGGLARHWSGAMAGAAVRYHARPATAMFGAAATFLVAMATLALVLRNRLRRGPDALLRGEFAPETTAAAASRQARRRGLLLAAACAAAALGVVAWALAAGRQDPVMPFFLAGSLLLAAGMAACWHTLGRLAGGVSPARLSLSGLALRNAARRRGRSMAVLGLVACGGFLVAAVSSMNESGEGSAARRDSGTGGFAFLGECAVPVRTPLDREKLPPGVDAVAFKVRDGDDASCLNLNRAQAPRLLGVRTSDMTDRGAFVAAGGGSPWALLNEKQPDGAVPALAGDTTTAVWGLQKRTGPDGETISYRDEMGRPFLVRLVGTLPVRQSVLSGTLIISMDEFVARFPSEAGSRLFLFDAPGGGAIEAGRALSRAFDRSGMDVVATGQRLAELGAVEATYLAMFLALGGLGLVLGSAGLGVVVMRNAAERRGELAVLRAVGFGRQALGRLLFAEHGMLLAAGLACGALAAAVAVAPAALAPGDGVDGALLGALLAGVAASGGLWTLLASTVASREDPLEALRTE